MTRLCLIILCAIMLLAGRAEADTLTLRECLERAAAANHELRVSSYDEKLAAEGVAIARSGYLPRLDLQGGYTFQQAPQSVLISGHAIPTQQDDYGFLSMAAEQTIYDFGRTSARYQRAKALRTAASLNHSAREKDVFLQVVEAYYGILEFRNFLRSAEEEVVQMTDHLRVAKNLFEQGVVTRNDLLQAEVQLANSRQRRIAEENRLANGWLYLNYLTGQQPGYRAELVETVHVENSPGEAGTPFDPANRAEVKALKQGILADELTIKEVKSYYFPEIFARLGMDYVENSKVVEQTILSATIGVRVNLFDGLATTSRYRQAVQSRAQAEEKLRMAESGIRLEYQTAGNDARTALERIRTAEAAVTSGEENLRINKNRYLEHVGTATDVIDAQTLLTRTRTEYHRAVFDYQVAVARTKKAKGEL